MPGQRSGLAAVAVGAAVTAVGRRRRWRRMRAAAAAPPTAHPIRPAGLARQLARRSSAAAHPGASRRTDGLPSRLLRPLVSRRLARPLSLGPSLALRPGGLVLLRLCGRRRGVGHALALGILVVLQPLLLPDGGRRRRAADRLFAADRDGEGAAERRPDAGRAAGGAVSSTRPTTPSPAATTRPQWRKSTGPSP